MKKSLLALTLIFFLQSNAQEDKYMQAMQSTLQQMDSVPNWTATAQKFQRIGEAEKTKWQPFYYSAMLKAMLSMGAKTTDEKELLADESLKLLEIANALSPNNSEILCLEAMANTAKMIVNPQARYMEYGTKVSQLVAAAKQANPANPRPYALEASNLFYTPVQFGGGCANALPIALKAKALAEKFTPASPIDPKWGKEQMETILAKCK